MPLATVPVVPIIRWLIYASSTAFDVLVARGYLSQLEDHDEQAIEWRRLQLVFTRATPTGSTEDVAVCTFDLANFTAGENDPSWTVGDYQAAEALFGTWWTACKAKVVTGVSLKEYRWYRAQFGEQFQSGPPERVTAVNVAGTAASTGTMPFQVAMSVTEKTPFPMHWGRFYLPGISDTVLDTYGRWTYGEFATIGNATATLYDGLYDAQLVPVVPSAILQSLLGVRSIQIDDVPDVIRSRRARTTLVRHEVLLT